MWFAFQAVLLFLFPCCSCVSTCFCVSCLYCVGGLSVCFSFRALPVFLALVVVLLFLFFSMFVFVCICISALHICVAHLVPSLAIIPLLVFLTRLASFAFLAFIAFPACLLCVSICLVFQLLCPCCYVVAISLLRITPTSSIAVSILTPLPKVNTVRYLVVFASSGWLLHVRGRQHWPSSAHALSIPLMCVESCGVDGSAQHRLCGLMVKTLPSALFCTFRL